MLIRIRRSKDLLLQFQSFECSSLFASNSCVYCTTRYNKCGRIGTKWLFFFTFIEECCVVIEKNIDKKLAIRICYQIWYKWCLKGKFGRGPNLRTGIQIRRDTGCRQQPAVILNPTFQSKNLGPSNSSKYTSPHLRDTAWHELGVEKNFMSMRSAFVDSRLKQVQSHIRSKPCKI